MNTIVAFNSSCSYNIRLLDVSISSILQIKISQVVALIVWSFECFDSGWFVFVDYLSKN